MILFLVGLEQCRQARTTYKGEFRVDVAFQYDGGVVVRESFNFGHLPIMLKVCALSFFFFFVSYFLLISCLVMRGISCFAQFWPFSFA